MTWKRYSLSLESPGRSATVLFDAPRQEDAHQVINAWMAWQEFDSEGAAWHPEMAGLMRVVTVQGWVGPSHRPATFVITETELPAQGKTP